MRPATERIGAFAGLDLDEGLDKVEALGFGETGEGYLLCLQAEAGATLLTCTDASVGYGGFHYFAPMCNTATTVAM